MKYIVNNANSNLTPIAQVLRDQLNIKLTRAKERHANAMGFNSFNHLSEHIKTHCVKQSIESYSELLKQGMIYHHGMNIDEDIVSKIIEKMPKFDEDEKLSLQKRKALTRNVLFDSLIEPDNRNSLERKLFSSCLKDGSRIYLITISSLAYGLNTNLQTASVVMEELFKYGVVKCHGEADGIHFFYLTEPYSNIILKKISYTGSAGFSAKSKRLIINKISSSIINILTPKNIEIEDIKYQGFIEDKEKDKISGCCRIAINLKDKKHAEILNSGGFDCRELITELKNHFKKPYGFILYINFIEENKHPSHFNHYHICHLIDSDSLIQCRGLNPKYSFDASYVEGSESWNSATGSVCLLQPNSNSSNTSNEIGYINYDLLNSINVNFSVFRKNLEGENPNISIQKFIDIKNSSSCYRGYYPKSKKVSLINFISRQERISYYLANQDLINEISLDYVPFELNHMKDVVLSYQFNLDGAERELRQIEYVNLELISSGKKRQKDLKKINNSIELRAYAYYDLKCNPPKLVALTRTKKAPIDEFRLRTKLTMTTVINYYFELIAVEIHEQEVIQYLEKTFTENKQAKDKIIIVKNNKYYIPYYGELDLREVPILKNHNDLKTKEFDKKIVLFKYMYSEGQRDLATYKPKELRNLRTHYQDLSRTKFNDFTDVQANIIEKESKCLSLRNFTLKDDNIDYKFQDGKNSILFQTCEDIVSISVKSAFMEASFKLKIQMKKEFRLFLSKYIHLIYAIADYAMIDVDKVASHSQETRTIINSEPENGFDIHQFISFLSSWYYEITDFEDMDFDYRTPSFMDFENIKVNK